MAAERQVAVVAQLHLPAPVDLERGLAAGEQVGVAHDEAVVQGARRWRALVGVELQPAVVGEDGVAGGRGADPARPARPGLPERQPRGRGVPMAAPRAVGGRLAAGGVGGGGVGAHPAGELVQAADRARQRPVAAGAGEREQRGQRRGGQLAGALVGVAGKAPDGAPQPGAILGPQAPGGGRAVPRGAARAVAGNDPRLAQPPLRPGVVHLPAGHLERTTPCLSGDRRDDVLALGLARGDPLDHRAHPLLPRALRPGLLTSLDHGADRGRGVGALGRVRARHACSLTASGCPGVR